MNFYLMFVECENVKASVLTEETLEIWFKGKSISDVLNMTVDEAVPFLK
jgi:excinuclease ABC subunit A